MALNSTQKIHSDGIGFATLGQADRSGSHHRLAPASIIPPTRAEAQAEAWLGPSVLAAERVLRSLRRTRCGSHPAMHAGPENTPKRCGSHRSLPGIYVADLGLGYAAI